jgi:hypothetical protein
MREEPLSRLGPRTQAVSGLCRIASSDVCLPDRLPGFDLSVLWGWLAH